MGINRSKIKYGDHYFLLHISKSMQHVEYDSFIKLLFNNSVRYRMFNYVLNYPCIRYANKRFDNTTLLLK